MKNAVIVAGLLLGATYAVAGSTECPSGECLWQDLARSERMAGHMQALVTCYNAIPMGISKAETERRLAQCRNLSPSVSLPPPKIADPWMRQQADGEYAIKRGLSRAAQPQIITTIQLKAEECRYRGGTPFLALGSDPTTACFVPKVKPQGRYETGDLTYDTSP